ncbi:glycogenin-2 isoform X15 [Hypanus sabinus]|uniref:glycogenin-2 isoform X15 n=1 Tax=Hypanus sabinus TaxID=79690 RepID=UPI0028C4E473|nr:glycogenin-2 isoform X15 [Hypanus sabinus]
MPVVTDQAFVTLATNDAYAKGALVLCQSLKRHNTTRQVVVLFTPQVSGKMRHALQCLFDEAREVNVLDSRDSAHLALLSRPELGITFTKIHCWCLVQYSKCVFMDADTLVCQNIDELFEREELSAAPDPGWPDCFNTGVFVYVPSVETYDRLLQFAVENGSFDGGDQGLLNSFFRNWSTMDIHKHLPFIYNLASIVLYSYLPAFKQFGASVKVVHFLGPTKPWHHTYSVETKSAVQESMSPMDSTFINFLNTWWDIYTTSIMPLLTQENGEKRETQKMPQVSTWQVSTIGQKETDAKEKTSLEPEKSEPVMDSQVQPAHVQPPQPPDSTGLSEPEKGISWESSPSQGEQPASANKEDQKSVQFVIESRSPSPEMIQVKEISPDTSEQTVKEEITDSFLALSLGSEPVDPDQAQDRRRWEEGNMDYMGKDAFANIQKKLDKFLK